MTDLSPQLGTTRGPDAWLDTAAVQRLPVDAVLALGLAPFYRKYVDAMGIPVVGSDEVSNAALIEAAYLVRCMLQNAPDIAAEIARNRVRVAVMACSERTRQVPEHSDLDAKFDKRARGLGATSARLASSCAEENLLGCRGDPYSLESIFVHEFAHTVHLLGLGGVGSAFDGVLRQTYDQAMEDKLWKDAVQGGQQVPTYASTNYEEYWAEGVQSYYACNWPVPNETHNGVNGRERLAEYDPRLCDLVAKTFGDNPWNYVPPKDRPDQPHLLGGDGARLVFAWTDADRALDA
jgi:hypothetical protein